MRRHSMKQYSDLSIKYQETLISITFFLHSKLNVLINIIDVMEKVFQVRTLKNRINVINKSFPDFSKVCCRKYRSL